MHGVVQTTEHVLLEMTYSLQSGGPLAVVIKPTFEFLREIHRLQLPINQSAFPSSSK